MKTYKVKAEIEIPKPPSFLRMTDGHTLPVSAVDEASLREIGKLWTDALVERAKEQGKQDV